MHSFDCKTPRNVTRRSTHRQFAGSLTATAIVSLIATHQAFAQLTPAPVTPVNPVTPVTPVTPAPIPVKNPTLSPTGKQQLSAILSDMASWSPTRKKIASQLIFTARMAAGQQAAPGVPILHPGIKVNADGTVRVVIRTTGITDGLLQAIQAAGGKVVASYPLTGGVYADVPLQNMELIAARGDVLGIKPPAKPHLKDRRRTDLGMVPYAATYNPASSRHPVAIPDVIAGPLAPFGHTNLGDSLLAAIPQVTPAKVIDEAYTTQGVAAITSKYGINGTGVKVGVLSDSVTTGGKNIATAAQAAGALPASVTIVQDTDGTAEGAAMLEEVYAIAPGAQLYFATGDFGEDGFASNIIALQSTYGCNIICDDLGYGDEPPFSDGIVAQAINQVVSAGALYFSAAGNNGHVLTDNTSHCFEGDFIDSGFGVNFTGTDDLGANVTIIGEFMQFGTDSNGAVIENPILDTYCQSLDLMWADPYYSVSDSYVIYTDDTSGNLFDVETGVSYEPYASVYTPAAAGLDNNGVGIVLAGGSGVPVHLTDEEDGFFNSSNDTAFEISTNSAIADHAGAASAFSMAAAPARTAAGGTKNGPYPGLFTATSPAEYFTSDGQRRIFYTVNEAGTGTPFHGTGGAATPITPGNITISGNGGAVLNKPDFIEADGTQVIDPTGLLANNGLTPFYGTSSATPHAAGMAALLKSFNYSSNGTTITGLKLGLAEVRPAFQASPLHGTNPVYDTNKGYGFINIPGAITFLEKFFDPSAKGVTVTGVGTAAITVTWQTILPSTSVVYYGQSATSTTLTAATTGYTTNHSVTIPTAGMNATQAHYFRVNSATQNGGVSYLDPGARVLNAAGSVGKANIILANLQLIRSAYSGSPAIAATITLTNTGSGSAADVQLTGATLGSSVPSSGALSTTNPFNVGAIASTKSQAVTLYFPAQASGTTTTFTYTGTDGNGASFSGTVRVALP